MDKGAGEILEIRVRLFWLTYSSSCNLHSQLAGPRSGAVLSDWSGLQVANHWTQRRTATTVTSRPVTSRRPTGRSAREARRLPI